jgi:cytochrome b involved in lipid metabolism
MPNDSAGNERVMNDTTMPPPARSSTAAAAPKSVPRRKVGRFGLADWTRLLASSNDLAQRKGQPLRKIKWDEIRQHKSVHDGWMVVKGKVYFISPYLAYHPGGETILKGVLGKDATRLYEKYHSWVNEDGYV